MDQKRKIAVIGAGTMGAGIAVQFAMYGYPVSLYSRTESTLLQAKKMVQACRLLLEFRVFGKIQKRASRGI